jgi:hypothetical protein
MLSPSMELDKNKGCFRDLAADRIVSQLPSQRTEWRFLLLYAISYLGNFSRAAAMCSTVGAPYFAPMVLCVWPVM